MIIVSPETYAAYLRLLRRDRLWYVRLWRWLRQPWARLYYRFIYWRFVHKKQDWGDFPPT